MAMVPCPECAQDISDKAAACPRCGFPVKPEPAERPDYRLVHSTGNGSSFAAFLRRMAYVFWVGGLIFAILEANVQSPVVRGYSVDWVTTFSWTVFFISLLGYIVNGFILYAFAGVIDAIQDTYDIVSTMRLERYAEKKPLPGKKGSPGLSALYPAGGGTGGKTWTCMNCRNVNNDSTFFCDKCSASREHQR